MREGYPEFMAKNQPSPGDVPVMTALISFHEGLHLKPIGQLTSMANLLSVKVTLQVDDTPVALEDVAGLVGFRLAPDVKCTMTIKGKSKAGFMQNIRRLQRGRWKIYDNKIRKRPPSRRGR